LAILVGWLLVGTSEAAITPAHRKDLGEIKKELAKVSGLIAKDDLSDAQKILDDSEQKLKKIAQEAGIDEKDRLLATSFSLIAVKRAALDKKQGKDPSGVSFTKDVAPILVGKCTKCHNEDRSEGDLKLDSFAGLKQGGGKGPLLTIGNAKGSQIMARITASGNGRMPKGGEALSGAEISAIGNWINAGAKFDGKDEADKLSAKATTRPANGGKPPEIVKASGDEKVKFTRDIAPFMANLCVRCHSGNNPRGGLSLVNFESLMKGGDSGRVVLPGNLEGSRLWRLVGGLEAPRMPQGQARITRTNYENLKTWFEEGAKFDGPDPKAPLTSFVKSEAELRAEELAKMSPEEFTKFRLEKTESQWKRANPREMPMLVESPEFYVYGNVSEERLKEVSDWANEHVKLLRSTFGIKGEPVWKGKLAIFVFKERFNYEEFPRVIEERDVPRETTGHAKVTPNADEAYVCLQDIGDEVTTESPGLHLNLIEHLTGAYLQSSGGQIPDWLVRGTGLALAARLDKKNEYIQHLPAAALESLKGIEKPADVFNNGTFSSADLGPVGYTLVMHMLQVESPQKFGSFVGQMQKGKDLNAALGSVYGADVNSLGRSYFGSLGSVKKPLKKK
jgi:hypothetical protein